MTVSVIIPAYNVATIVGTAIDSVMAQSRPALEIIVIDDGSGDATAEVVRGLALANPKIRLISLVANGGAATARNAGIAAAMGDWIGLLDADDTWAANRIETLLAIADEERADFVADNLAFFDHAAGAVARLAFSAPWKFHALDLESFFASRTPGAATHLNHGLLQPLVRRDFLLAHGIRYDESLRLGEDFVFNAEILLSGAKGVVVNQALYTYVKPVGGLSAQPSPHSRTARDRFGPLSQAVAALKDKHHRAITPAIARAMDERIAFFWKRHQESVANDLWRSRAFTSWAAFVLTKPDLVRFLMRRLPRRARELRQRLFPGSRRGS